MIVLLLVLLIVAGLVGFLIAKSSEEPPPDLDPEAAVKAAIELHAIRRKLDVSLSKSEQRRSGEQLRRVVNDALHDLDDDS